MKFVEITDRQANTLTDLHMQLKMAKMAYDSAEREMNLALALILDQYGIEYSPDMPTVFDANKKVIQVLEEEG